MREPSGKRRVLFADRQQARGWLVGQLSTAAIGVVTWAYLAMRVLDIGADAVVTSTAFAVLALGFLGATIWGRRASSGSRPSRSTGSDDGRPGRLRWERLLTEEAARQVGWSPALVVWVYRALMTVGIGLMVLTAVAWLSQLG